MSKKNEAIREQARQILREGICNMSTNRLVQMSNLGLMGTVEVSNNSVSIKNGFNHIAYDEEKQIIIFSTHEMMGKYGEISLSINNIDGISGCEDSDNPEEWLNVNIQMVDGTTIKINVLY